MANHGDQKFPLVELIRSLLPVTLLGKAMLATLLVWLIDWSFSNEQTLLGSEFLKKVFDIASLLGVIPLFFFALKGARWITQNLLWRLRRRLIVNYLLIGALPLLLIILLIVLLGIVVIIQSSADLVSRQLDGYLEQSRAAAESLSRDVANWDLSLLEQNQVRRRLQERANALAPIFPDLTLSVHRIGSGNLSISVKGISPEGAADQSSPVEDPRNLPNWLNLQNEFHGLAVEESGTGRRLVRARHIIKLDRPVPLIFQMNYPIAENLCEHLRHTTDLEVKPGQVFDSFIDTPSGVQIEQEGPLVREREDQAAMSWPIYKRMSKWSNGKQLQSDVLIVDLSFLMPGQVWRRLQQFQSGTTLGYAIVVFIVGLAFIFFLIALGAVISAVILTRSITGAIYYLYEGTKQVEVGDFDHEIPIKGRDQLSDLSVSFNRMTRSIRELLSVSAEKQRLDQEMNFAARVQSQLFPRSVPKTIKLDFAPGICIPARLVSGDYYDFLEVMPGITGIVVADVCGKGVSAALMMANLQANLRGQVQAYHDAYNFRFSLAVPSESSERQLRSVETKTSAHPVWRIVQSVNQQIVDSVIDANYITLFYAEFDEQNGTLRYTNAGHNPPLLLRASGDRKIERLERGGTVLGLFREIEYEDAELKLESGDLVVAFTDGLIEANNSRSEEFGEERLIQTLIRNRHLTAAEIEHQILQSVRDWTEDAEQRDDLTLVIFKVR